MIILNNIKLNIPEDTGKEFLTKLLGGRLNLQLKKLLKEERKVCIENIFPKAVYKKFEIKKVNGKSVYFKSGHTFNGRNISKILAGSRIAIIYIFTLGSKIDMIIKEESRSGNILEAIVLDAVTADALEKLGEYVGNIIKKVGIKNKSWNSTCTYSPGQFKWTIKEQKKIFNMVKGSEIGVKLNKNLQMVPFKSTSGVYGFGPKDKINKIRVACDICPKQNCISRR